MAQPRAMLPATDSGRRRRTVRLLHFWLRTRRTLGQGQRRSWRRIFWFQCFPGCTMRSAYSASASSPTAKSAFPQKQNLAAKQLCSAAYLALQGPDSRHTIINPYSSTSSTLRFLARPSSVLLVATGDRYPTPLADKRDAVMWYFVTSAFTTAAARRRERSRLESSPPALSV